jgi:uncharacterized protein (TIGR02001 family)
MSLTINRRLALLGLGLLAATAQASGAENAPAGATLTGNLTVVSQYVSRGFRQTWGNPALQGGIDYVHPSGLSLGTWMSTVSNKFVEDGTLEVDLYGGYSGSAGDIGYSALLYYYVYPGAEYQATATSYDYGELSFGLTYKYLYAKYNHTYTKEFFGITHARGTGYLDVGANIDLGSGLTLALHVGDGRVAGSGNEIWDWRDYKVGLSKTLGGGWSVAGAYTKAKGATNVYDAYTLGIPNSAGVVESSNPATGTFTIGVTRTF